MQTVIIEGYLTARRHGVFSTISRWTTAERSRTARS